MEEPLHPQIPAPLRGHSFLQASNFQLGFDRHPEGSMATSPHRFNYPPHWGTYLRKPILPPQCAGVLNQDLGDPWETRPESVTSYPAWPLAAGPDICPPASRLQMHTDPRLRVFTSTAQEDYACPSEVIPTQPRRVDKWDDSIPGGDKEKVPLPLSLYQQSYPAHKGLSSAVRAPNQHLGSDSTLKGDGDAYFESSYKSQYTGEWAHPPKRCHEGLISVVFGDSRCHDTLSEQRKAYPAPDPTDLCCYDTERAAWQVFRTNIQVGDRRQHFPTTMKESFQWKEAGRTSISYPHRNMSSILQGDKGAQKNKGNKTTSSLAYREASIMDLEPRQPSSQKCQATMRLGDLRLGSFSTTQQSDYCQPRETHRVYPKSSELMKSSVSFNFPGLHKGRRTKQMMTDGRPEVSVSAKRPFSNTGTSTSSHDMLVPHRPQKQQILEEFIQKLKHSHLVQPWQGQRWFSTEQREAYTDKYSGPITLAAGNLQCSSIPLGTLKTFRHRPKWPPGNHTGGNPCPER